LFELEHKGGGVPQGHMEEPSVNTPRSSGQSTSLAPRRGDEPEYETSNPLASHPGEEMSLGMRRALH